ncbi:hypothetical protein EDD85DRAFT_619314 [Armillaria nabsnona]|nr:hypothetical protein EDD85DRAFT_619314 [Armillaria nabsnona]
MIVFKSCFPNHTVHGLLLLLLSTSVKFAMHQQHFAASLLLLTLYDNTEKTSTECSKRWELFTYQTRHSYSFREGRRSPSRHLMTVVQVWLHLCRPPSSFKGIDSSLRLDAKIAPLKKEKP